MATSGRAASSLASYWGASDAMNQFCEAKYAMTPYIAEFWNTISNIPAFIIPGMYFFFHSKTTQGGRSTLMWVLFLLMGFGSFAFHCTMRLKWELLDEIPMILIVLAGIYSKEDTHWVLRGRIKVFVFLVSFVSAGCCLYMYIAKAAYNMFVNLFTFLVVLDLVLGLICSSEPDLHGSKVARGCLLAYIASLGFGRLIWETERHFCPRNSGDALAYLHVLWHFLAGLAVFYGILADTHIRWAALGDGKAINDTDEPWPFLQLMLPHRWFGRPGARKKGGAKSDRIRSAYKRD